MDHDGTVPYMFEFMRFPGEIRNNIYDYIISGLPQETIVTVLPSIAFANAFVHQELMSRSISSISYNVTSIPDIWYFNMLLDLHPEDSVLRKITKLSINNFTSIAHTRSRANEVMDFVHQFASLEALTLDIALEDLHHGLQGRIKDVDCVFLQYELLRLCELTRLTELVVCVKHNGATLTPGATALLSEVAERLVEGFKGIVVFLHYE